MGNIRIRRGDLGFHEEVWPTETAVRDRTIGGFDSYDGLGVGGDVRTCGIYNGLAGILRKISRKISIIFHKSFHYIS